MAADRYDLLDGPLSYLAHDFVGVLAPITLVAPDAAVEAGAPSEATLPLYTDRSQATAQLSRVPVEAAGAVVVRSVDAGDHRGKEEVLRAAAANGAARVAIDPDGANRSRASLPIELALGHLVGYKRNRACI